MKFNRKTKVKTEIPTSSMPDIIFMLLIFFMVTTVMKEFDGLPVLLPSAHKEAIKKLDTKRHVSHIWVDRLGTICINDKTYKIDDVRTVMWGIRAADPQLIVSMKMDKGLKMETVNSLHQEMRKADALKVNYSTKTIG